MEFAPKRGLHSICSLVNVSLLLLLRCSSALKTDLGHVPKPFIVFVGYLLYGQGPQRTCGIQLFFALRIFSICTSSLPTTIRFVVCMETNLASKAFGMHT
jgi:hypothetical protein